MGETAGLKVGEIIVTVHGRRILNVRQLVSNIYSYAVGDQADLEVFCATSKLSFSVPVLETAIRLTRRLFRFHRVQPGSTLEEPKLVRRTD